MKKIKYIFIFTISVLIVFSAFGQEKTSIDSAHFVKKTINGKKYYVYKIQKGNTLYSISKYFNVPINVIVAANPEVKAGLSIGEELRIPARENELQPTDTLQNKQVSTGGSNFILHKVQQDETLYSISKTYNVKEKDIVAVNPGIGKGIAINQIIRIPIAKIKKVAIKNEKQKLVPKYQTHLVQKHETLYSLSKEYKVKIKNILKVNDGLKGGLTAGQTINLPILLKPIKANRNLQMSINNSLISKMDSAYADSLAALKKDTYNVVIMLPFFVQQNIQMQATQLASKDEHILPKSKVALDFYNGFLLGIDSFYTAHKDSSAFIKLKIFDTAKDSAKVDSICHSATFQNADLIIGPLYLSCFKIAKNYALKYKKPIVVPVPQNSKILLNNPYVQKFLSATVSQMKCLADYIADSLKSTNLVIINHQTDNDSLWVSSFTQEYATYTSNKPDSFIYKKPAILKGSENVYDAIESKLQPNKNNVIIVPTNDKIFITQLLNRLNAIAEKDTITVVGIESWLDFNNLDPNFLNNMHLTVVSSTYADVSADTLKPLIKKYQIYFHLFPDHYTYIGFAAAQYYANMLNKYGYNFINNLTLEKKKFPFLNINYMKTGPQSGFANQGTMILKLNDYHFHIVYSK